MKTGYAFVAFLIIIVGALAVLSTANKTPVPGSIAVSGLSLCSSDCIYPAPYSSAVVTLDGSSVLQDFDVYVNETYLSTYTYSGNLTEWAMIWKAGVPQGLVPVVNGDSYSYSFIAHFEDGTTALVTKSTIAYAG